MNPIKIMIPYSFGGLEKLTTLNISYLQLERIDVGTFLGIGSNVLYLDASHNRLTHLEPGSFQGIEHSLEVLQLFGNHMVFVTLDVFSALGRLKNFHADSERYCLLLPDRVRCHFKAEYDIPCCRMVNDLIIVHFP